MKEVKIKEDRASVEIRLNEETGAGERRKARWAEENHPRDAKPAFPQEYLTESALWAQSIALWLSNNVESPKASAVANLAAGVCGRIAEKAKKGAYRGEDDQELSDLVRMIGMFAGEDYKISANLLALKEKTSEWTGRDQHDRRGGHQALPRGRREIRMDFRAPKYAREERTRYFRSLGKDYEEWDEGVLRRYSSDGERKDPWLAEGELTERGKAGIRFANQAYLSGDADVRCHIWSRLIWLYDLRDLMYSAVEALKSELDPDFLDFVRQAAGYAQGGLPDSHHAGDPLNPFLRAGRITLVPTACLEADASENLFPDRKELYEGYPELFGQPLNRMNLKDTLEVVGERGPGLFDRGDGP
jgi:hypothetical protein